MVQSCIVHLATVLSPCLLYSLHAVPHRFTWLIRTDFFHFFSEQLSCRLWIHHEQPWLLLLGRQEGTTDTASLGYIKDQFSVREYILKTYLIQRRTRAALRGVLTGGWKFYFLKQLSVVRRCVCLSCSRPQQLQKQLFTFQLSLLAVFDSV